MSDDILEKIERREARVAIVGLGYVGLPLAREFLAAGFPVVGYDIDPAKIASLVQGRSYVKSVASDEIAPAVREGRFVPTDRIERLRDADAALICVPTPLTKTRDPDLSFIEKTARALATVLHPGQLIVLESTTYPGTTDEVVRPILEETGLRAGKDFLLAFSPEREDPGNPVWRTRTIPKVVGADDPRSFEAAKALYAKAVVQVVPVSSTRAAEATKLLENIYRCVNIALVNELKVVFERMGIDVWEVIGAASTKPFGFHPFYPGPGLGGHCIPIDPFYLSWKAREFGVSSRFIELAGEVNAAMPEHVVARVQELLNDRGKALRGARVLVLGVAYKADVDDVRESPSLELIELLEARGAAVRYHDPHVPRTAPGRRHPIALESAPLSDALLAEQDAVLIATAHSAVDYQRVVDYSPLVIDTRNATRSVTRNRDRIVRA